MDFLKSLEIAPSFYTMLLEGFLENPRYPIFQEHIYIYVYIYIYICIYKEVSLL